PIGGEQQGEILRLTSSWDALDANNTGRVPCVGTPTDSSMIKQYWPRHLNPSLYLQTFLFFQLRSGSAKLQPGDGGAAAIRMPGLESAA
ncbi:MAG TPA: hypothetical protein VES39_02140, partial [Rhodospirillales bacterium]|nr:hypothetical protein [Rhodospirillales bacterium]